MSLPPRSERGSALIGVLLLLMVMSALTAAFTVSGHTETLIVRNHQTTAQARAAAEAGLNHAVEIVLPWILSWKVNGYASVDAALDALLAGVDGDPNFLGADLAFGGTDMGVAATSLSGTAQASYHVFLWDEDSPDRTGLGFTTLGGEEGGGLDDQNRSLVIQAVGYGPSNATARFEAIISPYKLPAVAVDGNITFGIAGAVVVGADSNGGIHTNGDVIVSGALVVSGLPDATKGTVTATGSIGTVVATGGSAAGSEVKDIPDINPADFEAWADRILTSSGTITTANGTLVATCTGPGIPCQVTYGLRYNSGTWEFRTAAATNYTYYVEGPVTVALTGTSALTPAAVTIIAEGSISGTQGYIKPHTGDLLMVTGKDLSMSGNFNAGVALAEGQILVKEQVAISGSAVIQGQLVIEDATTTAVPHTSSITGAAGVINNYDVGGSMFRVAGWREVR